MNFSAEVLLLSLLMFLGTSLLGWAPTWLRANRKTMNLVSIFGAGMLVGAAIIVVIPEAVKCIIEATYDPKSGEEEVVPESTAFNMGTAIVVGFTIMLIIDESFKILQTNLALEQAESGHGRFQATALKDFGEEKKILLNEDASPNSSGDEERRSLQINNVGAAAASTSQQQTVTHSHQTGQKKDVLITTIGLAIHSLADGAALGASLYLDSFGETKGGLGMIIFIAIMLHKAPASVGFGTFLMHQGCKPVDHAKHLMAFTASSPLMNILIFFGLCLSQSKATDLASLQFWVGILMLISAGSFLYVATIHILPEIYAMEHSHADNVVEQALKYQENHYSKTIELGVLLFGLYLPMALQFVPDE